MRYLIATYLIVVLLASCKKEKIEEVDMNPGEPQVEFYIEGYIDGNFYSSKDNYYRMIPIYGMKQSINSHDTLGGILQPTSLSSDLPTFEVNLRALEFQNIDTASIIGAQPFFGKGHAIIGSSLYGELIMNMDSKIYTSSKRGCNQSSTSEFVITAIEDGIPSQSLYTKKIDVHVKSLLFEEHSDDTLTINLHGTVAIGYNF